MHALQPSPGGPGRGNGPSRPGLRGSVRARCRAGRPVGRPRGVRNGLGPVRGGLRRVAGHAAHRARRRAGRGLRRDGALLPFPARTRRAPPGHAAPPAGRRGGDHTGDSRGGRRPGTPAAPRPARRRRRKVRTPGRLRQGSHRPRSRPEAVEHLAVAVCHIADTRAQAQADVRAAMPAWIRQGVGGYVSISPAPKPTRDPDAYVERLLEIHPVGTTAQCIDRLQSSAERTGIRRVLLMVEGTGDPRRTRETVLRLGAEVVPRLASGRAEHQVGGA